jgi:glycosyltransferase involved in cell wall biosynthesis
MRTLLLVSDPIGGSTSVQLQFLTALCDNLGSSFEITIYTPYCDPMKRAQLVTAGAAVLTPSRTTFPLNRILRARGGDNESMLWAESWAREAMLQRNSAEARPELRSRQFDFVVNLSMTVPVPSNLWWLQGTPLDQTIGGMARTNVLASVVHRLGNWAISDLDHEVMSRIQGKTRRIVANSPYLRDLHRDRGTPVEGVVYSPADLSDFKPGVLPPERNYVLMYMGKETEPINFSALNEAGVPVVAFGCKIPLGMHLRGIGRYVNFLGRVSREKLISLYSNALFTLFPFTCEPLGMVPLESMACGTPVLTYNRQGPATTVVNGRTGWLVETPDQLVEKATEVWQAGATGISPQACMNRAREFSIQRSAEELLSWLELSKSTVLGGSFPA